MDVRDSFVFYRSFFEAVSQLKERDQAAVLLAVCDYALNGVERSLSGIPAAMFMLIKPNLDANQRKYENGKKGGRPKTKTGTKPKPNDNLEQTETEPNVGCVMSNVGCGMSNGGGVPPSPSSAAAAYLDRVNPSASQQSLAELMAFEETMGTAVCLRAIDIALDEHKGTWSYIRGILRRWNRDGVGSLADIDRLEREHERRKAETKGGNVFLDMLEGEP